MDELDARIVREFSSPASPQWNVRESFSNVARKLGVDEETVRKRFNRAGELGSLPRWQLVINPTLIGRRAALIFLEVGDEDRKPEMISWLDSRDGIVNISNFEGRGMYVAHYYENDPSLKTDIDEIGRRCGDANPIIVKPQYPSSKAKMKEVDWRIVKELEYDARRSLAEVAESMGASLRRVERRLDFMNVERAAYIMGTPVFRNIVGVVCNFLVYCPDDDKKRAANRAVLGAARKLELYEISAKDYSMFVISCDNLAEAHETKSWLERLDGVKQVRMGVLKEHIPVRKWLDTEIAKHLSVLDTAPTADTSVRV